MSRTSGLRVGALAAVMALGMMAGIAAAQAPPPSHFGHQGPPAGHGGPGHAAPGPAPGRGQWLDSRYNHGHYYPARGAVVHELPGGYRPYYYHGDRFYFNAGVWYAPGPGGFIVTRPPVGLTVAVLPPFYSTVWFGGVPYYYADDTYYSWSPDVNSYVVATPPGTADAAPEAPPAGPPPPADDFYIYPRNGQSAEQQAADRYECHSWAKSQTNFDPTQPNGGVGPDGDAHRDQYRRAMSACLEARDYSVK